MHAKDTGRTFMGGLEIKNISKRFGDCTALDSISLDIKDGELFFLLGPSGCGKTTLLRIIAGFTVPDSGSISFSGSDLLSVPVENRNIGMVFQNYSLWPHMTVFENVAYGLKMRHVPSDVIQKKVHDALALVDMKDLGNRKPGALSGGQQQRVALARALVYEPEILLLDEPLSNLDAKLRKDMRAEIRKLHSQLGITMVYVTHDQEEAASMASHIALMNKGEIVQTGTPQELYYSPSTRFIAEFIGHANILSGIVRKVHRDEAEIVWGTTCFSVSFAPNTGIAPGMPVDVVLRPECLTITPQPPDTPGINILPGTIVSREFHGPVTHCVVDVFGVLLTVLSISFRAAPENSGNVFLSFRPADARCIPRS